MNRGARVAANVLKREDLPMWPRREHLGDRLVIAAVAVACIAFAGLSFLGGQISSTLSTVGSAVSTPQTGQGGSGGAQTGGSSGASGASAGNGERVAIVDSTRADLLVVRTGSLELQVRDVPSAVTAATEAVIVAGGYVRDSTEVGEGEDVAATVTFRIPVDKWAGVTARLRAMAIKVVAAKTQTDNVTADVVDLEARIANLEVTERALQAIMIQATKIEDVLKIQKELTVVRGDIEVAVARKKSFEDQAALSTLTVRFGLEPVAAVVAPPAQFDPAAQVDRATAQLVHRLEHTASAAIWFGIVWLPFVLALGMAALIAWLVIRWFRMARTTAQNVSP